MTVDHRRYNRFWFLSLIVIYCTDLETLKFSCEERKLKSILLRVNRPIINYWASAKDTWTSPAMLVNGMLGKSFFHRRKPLLCCYWWKIFWWRGNYLSCISHFHWITLFLRLLKITNATQRFAYILASKSMWNCLILCYSLSAVSDVLSTVHHKK